ncbi:MAG: hypothetical protein J6S67_05895 [Methanobrevibacter sp.]|nr:hypothetical protein [Methanobrevibacter sp.]
MKFEDIKKVNETIVTTDIKGKEYAEVNQRVKAFRMLYPEGTIETELVSIGDGMCIMRAKVYSNSEHGLRTLLGTGTAYEKENSTFINKTSYIENCETSAVGRALAMCGIGIDTSIASKEEVENAIKQQEAEEEQLKAKGKLLASIKTLMAKKKVLPNEISEHFEKSSADMSDEELQEVVKWLEEK